MKKSKPPEIKPVDELEEEAPIERLSVNMHGADVEESDDIDDIDSLLREEKSIDDKELDKLFTDEKKTKYDDVEVEVRKALYQSKTSNASLIRANKSAEVTKKTRSEEVANYKTLEDDWDGVIVEEAKRGKPLVYLTLILLAAIIGAGVWALWNVSKNDQIAHEDIHESRKLEQQELSRIKAEATIEIKKIEDCIMQFANAESTEDRLKFIHDAKNLEEKVVAYYKQSERAKNYVNIDIKRVVEELINDSKVWTAICTYGYIDNSNYELFFLHKDADGGYKLDWKAIAGVQDYDWHKFVNEQSTEPIEIRVVVEPKILDGHYNWGFSDNEYSAYKLTLNNEQIFWGYIKNTDVNLVKLMKDSVSTMGGYQRVYELLDIEMILKVAFHENTHELNKQCVEIVDIVSPHWLDTRINKEVTSKENLQE